MDEESVESREERTDESGEKLVCGSRIDAALIPEIR